MPPPTNVALVIPAWNEAESIGAVLDEVPPSTIDHLLVVVGGPTDPTAAVARAHGGQVLVQQQRGYGAACWTGAQAALAADAQIIAFLDGDYADPPAALARILAPLLDGRADLVLGCRDLSRHPNALPLHARLGNRFVLLLLRALLGRRFVDLPSFKAIRADALRLLELSEMTYGWTVEMLVKAARANLRITEVAVEYRPRLGGQSKVAGNLRGSLGAAAKLISCAIAYAAWRPV
ncbi:MAG TPA: glycosyltransferase family 2 protein [Chloroflexota bacterium]